MIDLDPLWRLVIVLATGGVIPLLLVLAWAARRVRDSCSMTWFVASLRDEDTHLGENSADATVTARRGRSFRPLVGLAGSPPDPLQVCPTCAQSQRSNPSCP